MAGNENAPIKILDAYKYAQIEAGEGPVAALKQLAKDLNARDPEIESFGSRFRATIPDIEIGGDGSVKGFIARSGNSPEVAATALLKALLNPETASGKGEPYLSVAGAKYSVTPLAVLAA